MPTRGVARDVDAVGITAEALRVAMHPGHCPAYLLGQHQQVAADILHPGEVRNDEVGAAVDEQLRGKRRALRALQAPLAPVDEDVDRRVGALGRAYVERLDGAGA